MYIYLQKRHCTKHKHVNWFAFKPTRIGSYVDTF